MNSDKLEAFIESNRESFEEEPKGLLDVWDKLTAELHPMKVVKPRAKWWQITRVAATVVIAIGIAFLVIDRISNRQQKPVAVTLHDINPELASMEEFYQAAIETKMLELNKFEENGMLEGSSVHFDLASFDSAYVELHHELQEGTPTIQVVERLIKYYQVKLKVLESILNRLEERQKTIGNEVFS